MRLLLLTPESIPSPQELQTKLRKGVLTKRHEFRQKDQEDAFVVFEGEEQRPFWRRAGDGVRFVFTNLTFATALATANQEGSFLAHTVSDTDGGEFIRYYRKAHRKLRS